MNESLGGAFKLQQSSISLVDGKASRRKRKTIKSSKNYQQDKTPKCLFETGNQLEILGSNHHLPTGGRLKEKRPYKMNDFKRQSI